MGRHNYGKSILEVGVKSAMKTMKYDDEKFVSRGGVFDWGN
jgi:hypothetical protein